MFKREKQWFYAKINKNKFRIFAIFSFKILVLRKGNNQIFAENNFSQGSNLLHRGSNLTWGSNLLHRGSDF
jgi:hypothetical protein